MRGEIAIPPSTPIQTGMPSRRSIPRCRGAHPFWESRMAASHLALLLSAALGAAPNAVPPGAAPVEIVSQQPPSGGFIVSGEPVLEARYPFDAPSRALHGYAQDVPAFGGFNAFRPYNYKHILAQSQIAQS